jgi:hypothetical protein
MKPDEVWLQTYTGVQFRPLDPQVEDIRIDDIAHALSNQCRFSGHCREFYSVADHSVWVSRIVPPEHALWGLLHDAGEAYLVDLPRPIKHGSEMGAIYREAENRLMRAVCQRFGLLSAEPTAIRAADQTMLFTEQRDLMGGPPKAWRDPVEPLPMTLVPLAPKDAERAFLRRFAELTA